MAVGKGGAQQMQPGVQPGATTYQAPNVMQSAAQGIHGAMAGSVQGMGYNPMYIDPSQFAQPLGGFGGGGASGAWSASGGGAGPAPKYNITADQVTAGQLAGTDLSAYTNPYETQVVDQSMGDIERARLMQERQLNAQATAAGAFGGSRQALMQSELGRNSLDQSARTASGLRAAGFQNAQQMGLADIGNTMQADLANQGANLTADQAVLQAQNQAYIANQNRQASGMSAAASSAASMANAQLNAQLQAQLANQAAHQGGAQFRLGASNQLGNQSNLGFGMGQQAQNGMMQAGNQQQMLQQQLIDAGRGQYQQYAGQPAQGLGYVSQALGAAQAPQSTQQTRQPGLFDYLTLGASMYPG